MRTQEARELGDSIARLAAAGESRKAHSLLAPVLAQRTPFRLLDLIGAAVGAGPLQPVDAFLEQVAASRTEGGWVVIASALGQQMDRDLPGAFRRCRDFIIAADIWYATDILGERVPGPALLSQFEPTLALLAPWREDRNRWIRRTVGVAAHFWGKRTHGRAEHGPQAESLLSFLEPMFEEREMDAVKGVGWGLKTLGRYYPTLVADWLAEQVVQRQRPHRTLMLRKALTYLPTEQRARVTGAVGR
jgi:3-methyladenine DNA glycosylase AlkD